MLSEKERDRRWQMIKKGMVDKGWGALLICGNTSRKGHIQYVSGYSVSFDGSYLVFPLEAEPTLYVFSSIQAARASEFWIKDSRQSSRFGQDIAQRLKEVKAGRGKIGVVGLDILPAEVWEYLKEVLPQAIFEKADDLLLKARAIKSQEELALMEESALLADEAFRLLKRRTKSGITEFEIYGRLDYFLRRNQVEESFNLIASGPLPIYPYFPTARVIRSRERLSLEITPRYYGYYTQLTVGFSLGGPGRLCQRLIRVCLEAYQKGVKMLVPGARAKEVAATIGRVVKEAGYVIPFRPGHGLGLEVDELPRFGPDSPDILEPGMTMVIHPSVLVPEKGGVFLGNTFVITEQGARCLNRTVLKEM